MRHDWSQPAKVPTKLHRKRTEMSHRGTRQYHEDQAKARERRLTAARRRAEKAQRDEAKAAENACVGQPELLSIIEQANLWRPDQFVYPFDVPAKSTYAEVVDHLRKAVEALWRRLAEHGVDPYSGYHEFTYWVTNDGKTLKFTVLWNRHTAASVVKYAKTWNANFFDDANPFLGPRR